MRGILAIVFAAFFASHAFAQVVGPSTGTSYPSGATPTTSSSSGGAGGTSATLAAVATQRTWICGFSIYSNATAAATGNATISGTVGGTLNFNMFTAPLASGMAFTGQNFTPCIPSSAINTQIQLSTAGPGSGGTVSATAWGYQQ